MRLGGKRGAGEKSNERPVLVESRNDTYVQRLNFPAIKQ